jgi:hypothetical protein
VPPAGKKFGDTIKSGKERCYDAIRKGLTGITAIVRPMDTKYGVHAAMISVSIKAPTTR